MEGEDEEFEGVLGECLAQEEILGAIGVGVGGRKVVLCGVRAVLMFNLAVETGRRVQTSLRTVSLCSYVRYI